jgi:hypothetical protein
MKESTKGALLSFLVYPGLGQLVLGFKSSGVFFAVLATFCLLVIVYRLTMRIYQALDPMISLLANNSLSLSKTIEILNQSSYSSWRVEGLSLAFLMFCWIAAGLHAVLAGGRIDRKKG